MFFQVNTITTTCLILPDEYGTRRPPYYFLTPSYWSGKSRRTSKKSKKVANSAEVVEDEDVKAERELVINGKLPQNSVVTVNGLKKVYKDKSAVDGVYFGIESDTLFCLLGPNGNCNLCSIYSPRCWKNNDHSYASWIP